MIDVPSIAFIGRAGSGKTTAAEHCVQQGGFQRLSFASALKQCAQRIWGPSAATDRDKLQRMGVAIREIDPDAWVNALLLSIKDFQTTRLNTPQIVIDDCRFENEYWALKGLGFAFVRVEAPQEIRVDRLMKNGKLQDLSQLDHVSETEADKFDVDWTIGNADDLTSFKTDVLRVLRQEEARS
jgi:dephospho-CoA kinase